MNKILVIGVLYMLAISCKTYVTVKPGRYIQNDKVWIPNNTDTTKPTDWYSYDSKKGKFLRIIKVNTK